MLVVICCLIRGSARDLNNQHLYYLKLLQGEIDSYQAITVAGSGHFGYRNLISDFRTLLIILAINTFHEVWLTLFFRKQKVIVCVTNFDHNLLLS